MLLNFPLFPSLTPVRKKMKLKALKNGRSKILIFLASKVSYGSLNIGVGFWCLKRDLRQAIIPYKDSFPYNRLWLADDRNFHNYHRKTFHANLYVRNCFQFIRELKKDLKLVFKYDSYKSIINQIKWQFFFILPLGIQILEEKNYFK